MAVKLNSTGGGSVTLDTPSTASNYTVTLPAANATLADTSSTQTLTNKTLTAAGSNTVEATSGPTSTQLAGQRNKIINGAMMIDQRNAGASVSFASGDGTYVLDRWRNQRQSSGTMTVQRSNSAPAGFVNSMLFTVTGAVTPGASDFYTTGQVIENVNISDLAWGTASAKSITVSFWVNSSVTGAYSASFSNYATYDSGYIATFSISSANTWQYVTITIPGPTSGTWTASISLYFRVDLGSGSNYNGSSGSWGAVALRTSGSVQLIANSGATFYITGVQLEKGATATPFENRLYGTELALCQRYYSKSFLIGTAPVNGSGNNRQGLITIYNSSNADLAPIAFPVSMRSAPTLTFYNPTLVTTPGNWAVYPNSWGGGGVGISAGDVKNSYFVPTMGSVPGVTNYMSYICMGDWTASAEL